MATSLKEIRQWLLRGRSQGATHVIVVCDTFDWEDYPVYVHPTEEVCKREAEFDGKNMQRVMEVYNLAMGIDEQLAQSGRVFNY